jgi:hypothetical protein
VEGAFPVAVDQPDWAAVTPGRGQQTAHLTQGTIELHHCLASIPVTGKDFADRIGGLCSRTVETSASSFALNGKSWQ